MTLRGCIFKSGNLQQLTKLILQLQIKKLFGPWPFGIFFLGIMLASSIITDNFVFGRHGDGVAVKDGCLGSKTEMSFI